IAGAGFANVCVAGSQPNRALGESKPARVPIFTSCVAMVTGSTMVVISGINAHQASTDPATNTPDMRGPITYPTPRYSGVISPLMVADGQNLFVFCVTNAGNSAMT